MSYAAFRFTPSSVAFFPETLLASAPSTTFSLAFGPCPDATSRMRSSPNVIRSLSKARRVKKHRPQHQKRWNDWSTESYCVNPVSTHCQPTSSCPCFRSNLYRFPRHLGSLVTYQRSLSPVTEPRFELLHSFVASAFANVGREALIHAPVTASIHNRIATSGGTAIATAFTLATTSICSRRRTVIMTCHFILDWDELPAMTPFHSSSASRSLSSMIPIGVGNGCCSMRLMTRCPFIAISNPKASSRSLTSTNAKPGTRSTRMTSPFPLRASPFAKRGWP